MQSVVYSLKNKTKHNKKTFQDFKVNVEQSKIFYPVSWFWISAKFWMLGVSHSVHAWGARDERHKMLVQLDSEMMPFLQKGKVKNR